MAAERRQVHLVVEGAIPTKDGGHLLQDRRPQRHRASSRTSPSMPARSWPSARASSWGGIPSAGPESDRRASSVRRAAQGQAGRDNLPAVRRTRTTSSATVLEYATFGTLPALDAQGRPKFAYGRTIHEHCPRRAHFDAGRFAEAVRRRGPSPGLVPLPARLQGTGHTRCELLDARTSTRSSTPGRSASAIPCFGCSEEEHRLPHAALPDASPIQRPTPPDTYPPIAARAGHRSVRWRPASPGLIGGALLGAGYMASRKLATTAAQETAPNPIRTVRQSRSDVDDHLQTLRSSADRGRLGHGSDGARTRADAAPGPHATGRRRRPALRHDALHRLQGVRRRVCGRERPGPRHRVVRRQLAGAARSQRLDEEHHQALSDDGAERSFVKQQCMHCVDPACANACMLGALKKGEFGHRRRTTRRCASAAATARWRVRSTSRSSSGRTLHAEDRQVRAVPASARTTGRSPRAPKSARVRR